MANSESHNNPLYIFAWRTEDTQQKAHVGKTSPYPFPLLYLLSNVCELVHLCLINCWISSVLSESFPEENSFGESSEPTHCTRGRPDRNKALLTTKITRKDFFSKNTFWRPEIKYTLLNKAHTWAEREGKKKRSRIGNSCSESFVTNKKKCPYLAMLKSHFKYE